MTVYAVVSPIELFLIANGGAIPPLLSELYSAVVAAPPLPTTSLTDFLRDLRSVSNEVQLFSRVVLELILILAFVA